MLTKLLRAHLGAYKRPLLFVVLFQLAQTLAALYLPTLNADIIDYGVVKGDTGYILRIGAVMLAVSLVQVVCALGAVYYGARSAMGLGRDIRAAVFHRVQDFSAREVGQFGTPSLITRTTNDVQQVQTLAVMMFVMVASAPIMAVGGIALALDQDVPLSGLLLVAVPLLGVGVGFIIARMRPAFRSMQTRIDGINRVLREQITGIRVIRAFVRDTHERERFTGSNSELLDVSLRVGRLTALMSPVVMLVFNASSVAVLWFGAGRIDSGAMQVGALTAFLSYLMQILMSVMMTTFMFMMLPRAEVCAERIQEVLATAPSVVPAKNPVRLPEPRGEVELRGVEFRYPGAEQPVLHDIDLVARPGETTAIIGGTGSGKTTLLSLVPRLFDVTAGTVFLDGVDVRELDADSLSSAIGIVPQRAYLFSGTIASNLRYGNPDATDEELWRALEIAQARDFVEKLPDQLEAPIAQGGTNVSGGQRQRLAIARMLVHRAPVLLFDDSFSALDYATDAALRAALADETTDSTVVIVAQRISTIRHADRIVVLDEGRVVGTGRHEELMGSCEVYREIVLSQLSEAEAA
ncbi:ABC transporter ATP-binding protein [Allokutzneria multivorans]|uniref:ABC transporter ATP-binding protein n=1 Tax=Allokutzneria multivorans TaxID=1142134 RepID=A0ABP7SJ81_9PSEU